MLEILREALRAGAHPEYFLTIPGAAEILFQEASDEQLRYIPVARRMIAEEYEAALTILAPENTRSLSGADPQRVAVMQQAVSELVATQLKRTRPDLLYRGTFVHQ
ncbi:MAG TPA: aminopeptidase [Ktedonobacteraceae bacterium]|nr:aminopeptidase [Ktedonobacteraceae bacterium]